MLIAVIIKYGMIISITNSQVRAKYWDLGEGNNVM